LEGGTSSRVKNLFWFILGRGGGGTGIEDEASSSMGSVTWGSGVFSFSIIMRFSRQLVTEAVGEEGMYGGVGEGSWASCCRRGVSGLKSSSGKRLGGWSEDAPVIGSGVGDGAFLGAVFGDCCGFGYNIVDGGAIRL